MCGFAGLLNNSFPIQRSQLSDIARKVSFRGPDSCVIKIYDDSINQSDWGRNALFFNRLAIIDLDTRSNQPFEDDRYTLLFNGEIYNYLALKNELTKAGVVFHTTSDTEVLFYGMQKWGIDCIRKLNGMFAFCWIDRMSKSFILARDRMGIKPLYYRRQNNNLVFASELDSVLRLSGNTPELEQTSIQQFLWMQYIPTPLTIVEGVFKLAPGHFIEGSWDALEKNQKILPKEYWDAYVDVHKKTVPSDPSDLERIMVDSLSRQLIADVSLGLFLSSGVDSSLLAALVNKHFAGDKDFNFFTVAFSEETSSDESEEAFKFIRGFQNPRLINHQLTIDAELIGNRLDTMYEFVDEPFGDPATLLNWVIASKAKEFVTVVLSGDGADELFWGYNRYDQWKNPSLTFNSFRIPGAPASVIKPFIRGGFYQTKAELELSTNPVERHFNLFLSPSLEHLRQNPPWNLDTWAMDHISLVKERDDLPAVMDLKTYLADAMLYKVDRASMASSLEVRVPYLDNLVVDYALALPFSFKSNKQIRHKAILKQLLHQLAPHYDIQRPKKGFNFPLEKWLRSAWKDRVLALVDKNCLQSFGLDDRIYLPMIQNYYAGDKKPAIVIWFLLNLALWKQKFETITPLRSA